MNIKKAASIILVILMLAVAVFLNNKEIIFPEIAALAVGAWVMEKSPWQSRSLNLWLSPTLAAFTGMALLKLFPYNPILMIAAALILVIIELELVHSDVFPAISAAILPIIVHANSWLYPLSVCLLTGIVFCGKVYFNKASAQEDTESAAPDIQTVQMGRYWFRYWAKISAVVILVAVVAVKFDSIYLIAPPLIVVLLELTQPRAAVRKKPFRALLLIALAAFSGVFWLVFTVQFLHLPMWSSGILSTGWLFLLYYWLGFSFPPAAAITLLPIIIPVEKLWLYPFQVTLGCGIFVAVALIFFSAGPFEHLGNKET